MLTLTDLQHRLGFTRNEVIVILFLASGLLAGSAIRYFRAETPPAPEIPAASAYAAQDSEFAARARQAPLPPHPDAHAGELRASSRKTLPDSAGIDINGASEEDLLRLPGIGRAYARRIIAYRTARGPFRAADDLLNVPGIGEKRFRALRPFVTVR